MIKGLIGEHLSHSYSKIIHEMIMDYRYELIELKPDEVEQFFINRNFDALNVTIPYKSTVIPYLDEISEDAKKIGAVNTVVNQNNKLIGYNTDVYGFEYTLKYFKIQVKGKKVIVLGNGGASKAVVPVLKQLGASKILLVKKNISLETITYEQCYQEHNDAQVIINASFVGMYPNSYECPIDLVHFNNLESVVDCIYNPLNTKLVLDARQKNVQAVGGLMMLVAQAVKAIEYFNHIEIDKKVIENVYNKISNEKANLVLIGMPGCGKSSIAKMLAKNLNRQWIDIDQLIESEIKMPIKDYFERYGEEAFREIETKCTKECSKHTNCVISCGGGIIKKHENMISLMMNGTIIYVDRDIEKLAITKDRPLSKDLNQVKKLYNERIELYRKYAQTTVENNSSIHDAVRKCIKIVKKEN